MRFHPNRRESRDHTPGPIMDSAIPIAARRILLQGSPDLVMKPREAAAATMHPETGVHKPTDKSAPAIIAANCRIAGSPAWGRSNPRKLKLKTALHATSRKIRRPAPGQPCANVEKRRRKRVSLGQRGRLRQCDQAPTGSIHRSFGDQPADHPRAKARASRFVSTLHDVHNRPYTKSLRL
jgi:hypothetical protein